MPRRRERKETADGFWLRGSIWYTRIAGVRTSTGCKDYRAAQLWRAEQERRNADPTYAATHLVTVREAVSAFVTELQMGGRRPATLSFYAKKLGHWLRFFGGNGEETLAAVTLPRVHAFIALRLTEEVTQGKPVSRQTIAKELAAFRAVLHSARHRGEFDRDPALVFPRRFSAPVRPGRRYLERDKVEAVVALLPPHRGAWLLYALATGARYSEVESAQRKHVDFASGTVLIDGTKTLGSYRTIPILPFAEPMLRRAMLAGGGKDGKLLRSWHATKVSEALGRAVRRLGLGEGLSPNDLRRSFATWLVQDGVPPNVVAWMLGHRTSAMVERHYGRMTPEAAGKLVAAILKARSSETDQDNQTGQQATNRGNRKGDT